MGTKILSWLLGLEDVTSFQYEGVSFGATWAREGGFWLVLLAIAALVLATVFYVLFQSSGSTFSRVMLGFSRAMILTLLVLTLADPILHVTKTSQHLPRVYVVFDGTDSMNIRDRLKPEEIRDLNAALGIGEDVVSSDAPMSRIEYVWKMLTMENSPFELLQTKKKYQLEAFVFDGNSTSQLRRLNADDPSRGEGMLDWKKLADAKPLSTKGRVTAFGAVLNDARNQVGASHLAAMIVISDFCHNSGDPPIGTEEEGQMSPAQRLGAKIYTVGIGATTAANLAVTVQPPPKLKVEHWASVTVKLQQTEMNAKEVTVNLLLKRIEEGESEAEPVLIGKKNVTLSKPVQFIDLPFKPEKAGRFEIIAEVEPLEIETLKIDNRSARKVRVIDDYLRLLYVAKEPSWEWRFMKEVFHRDKDIGLRGFRTYLSAADVAVRRENPLFVATLSMEREEFFKTDVIILGDMPRDALTDAFCKQTKEFVSQFGGGLIILAGPQFGPKQLIGTPLESLLPVTIAPDAKYCDKTPFRLQRTIEGRAIDFMQLGSPDNKEEGNKIWDSFGPLPWYQPVTSIHSQATILAVHPTDTLPDGVRPQPLIVIRPYGANGGEVVYIAFDELWRLRRLHGETYYRQFWSQLIHRLGLSHALGGEKRFVVRTSQAKYLAGDEVTLTVAAYDKNFEPLGKGNDGSLDQKLTAELVYLGRSSESNAVRPIEVSMLRPGVFEQRFQIDRPGPYRIRVKDPITGTFKDCLIEVVDSSPERRSSIRNKSLQDSLAMVSGGRSYDIVSAIKGLADNPAINGLVEDMDLQPRIETKPRIFPLWSTPLWFILVVVLMLGEWFSRKLINLS